MATKNLAFDVTALDKASAALLRIAEKVERVTDRLEELDRQRADPKIDADAAGALAKIATVSAAVRKLDGTTARVKVDVDRSGLDILPGLLGGLGGLGGAVSNAGRGIDLLTGSLGQFRTAASSVVGVVASIVTGIVRLTAVAAAGAVAGAGITAAWGAAATALAALPGIVAVAAAGIGTLILGFDGVKRAAATLKPEFDALKASVSEVFERGLTPAFRNLETIFPSLTAGARAVATSISGIAVSLSEMVREADKAGQLDTLFLRIAGAIAQMEPGIRDTAIALGEVASRGAAIEILTETVNRFGAAFRSSVTSLIADGTLDRALNGLRDLLGEVSEAFVSLVDNGIRAFSTAAPGLSSFLNDITAFFERFDWERLGASVGSVFEGIGQIFRDVDPATVESITSAFERLGETFKDPDFQAGVQKFIDALPLIIGAVNLLVQAIGGLPGAFGGVLPALLGFEAALTAAFIGPLPQIINFPAVIGAALSGAIGHLLTFPGIVGAAMGAALAPFISFPGLVGAALGALPGILIGIAGSAMGAFAGAVAAGIAGVVGQIATLPGLIGAALGALPGLLLARGREAMAGLQSGIVGGLAGVLGVVAGIPGRITSAIGNLGGLLVSAGRALMSGLLAGIVAGATAVYNYVAGIAARIRALKGPLPYDRTVLVPAGEALMSGLRDGLSSGMQKVEGMVSGFAPQIGATITAPKVNPLSILGGSPRSASPSVAARAMELPGMGALRGELQELRGEITRLAEKSRNIIVEDRTGNPRATARATALAIRMA